MGKQLDFMKCCEINGLWSAGYNQSEIANKIGVHKSTIRRELKRNITFFSKESLSHTLTESTTSNKYQKVGWVHYIISIQPIYKTSIFQ